MGGQTYGEDIDDTHNNHNDPSANCEAPERKTQVLLSCGSLVEIPKQIIAQQEHGKAKHDEPMLGTEKWPVSCEPRLEQW